MEEGETKAVGPLNADVTAAECLPNSHLDVGHISDPYTNINNVYKNGINGLELLMSMAGDMNKNLARKSSSSTSQTNSLTDGNSNDDYRSSIGTSRNHASQLLLAAASVVSNGFVNNGLRSYIPENDYMQDIPRNTRISSSNQDSIVGKPFTDTSTTNSTTVSFSSTPTMSTGVSSASSIVQLSDRKTNMYSINSTDRPTPSISQPLKAARIHDTSNAPVILNASSAAKSVIVPFLWKRVVEDGTVGYRSPSDEVLKSLEEIKKYLLSEETCKCGLPCPFHVEKVFNFDPSVESQTWKLSDIDVHMEASVRACCHQKHIRSSALAKEGNAVPKTAKPSPSRRRGNAQSQKTGSRKSVSAIARKAAQQSKKALDGVVERTDPVLSLPTVGINPLKNTTPIPPIETMMRSPQSMYTPPHSASGLHSPRHFSEMMSPSIPMLSPHASAGAPSGHMVPVIAHTGYPHPSTGLLAQQMYRHPAESGILSPGIQPGFYPVMQGLPPHTHPHRPMAPYPHPPGFDYMQSQPRPWNAIPPMQPMPPPGGQFGVPIWHAKSEVPAATNTKKRRRRASSISSNGGNSDTGYTSGLSSPAHASPGQNKERNDGLMSKSKHIIDERRTKTDSEVNCSNTNLTSTSLDATKKAGNTGPAMSMQEQEAQNRHASAIKLFTEQSVADRVPQHHHAPYTMPNGIPTPVYADPTHQQRQAIGLGYPAPSPQHQPLPPIYLTERPPRYPPSHLDKQVIRGVYSQSPHSNTTSPGPRTPSSAAQNDTPNSDRTGPGVMEKAANTGKSNTVSANGLSNNEIKSHEKSNNFNFDDKTCISGVKVENIGHGHHAELMSGIHPSQQMMMNGFQPHFNQPIPVAPGLHYSSGPPGIPRDYAYHTRPPMHMIRAPNGQLFYRYAQDRMPMPPQPMPYPGGSNSMYHQMSYITGRSPPATSYTYPPSNNQSAVSPKRKRRKANAKTVIESHSAVLAGKNNNTQDKPAANATPSTSTESVAVNESASRKTD